MTRLPLSIRQNRRPVWLHRVIWREAARSVPHFSLPPELDLTHCEMFFYHHTQPYHICSHSVPLLDNENLKICFKKKICLKISKKQKFFHKSGLAPGVFGMQLLRISVALSAASQWRDAIKCCPSGECKLCSSFHSVAHVLDWGPPVSVPHLKLCLSQIPLPMSH